MKKPIHKTLLGKLFSGTTLLSRFTLGFLDVVPLMLGTHNMVREAVKKSTENEALVAAGRGIKKTFGWADMPGYIAARFQWSRGASAVAWAMVLIFVYWNDPNAPWLDIIREAVKELLLNPATGLLVAFGMMMAVVANINPIKAGQRWRFLPPKIPAGANPLLFDPGMWIGNYKLMPGDVCTVSTGGLYGITVDADGEYLIHPDTLGPLLYRFELEGADGEAGEDGEDGVAAGVGASGGADPSEPTPATPSTPSGEPEGSGSDMSDAEAAALAALDSQYGTEYIEAPEEEPEPKKRGGRKTKKTE